MIVYYTYLSVHVQSLRTMQCVMDVCRAAGHTRGGELLNTVHRVVRFDVLYDFFC